MKRKVLLSVLVLLLSLSGFSQSKTDVDWNDVIQYTKTTGEHAYQVMVHQQLIDSYIQGTLALVMLVFIVFSLRYTKRKIRKNQKEKMIYSSDMELTICIMSGIMSIIFTIFIMVNLNNIISGFVNPEGAAIREIMCHLNNK